MAMAHSDSEIEFKNNKNISVSASDLRQVQIAYRIMFFWRDDSLENNFAFANLSLRICREEIFNINFMASCPRDCSRLFWTCLF